MRGRLKNPIEPNELGGRLYKLRKDRKWTLSQVAHKLQVENPNTVSRYEHGERYPGAAEIIALAKIYECSTDYLLLGAEPNNNEIFMKTGLTEEAINNLARLKEADDMEALKRKNAPSQTRMRAINRFLSSGEMLKWIITFLSIPSEKQGYYAESRSPTFSENDVFYTAWMSPDAYAVFLKQIVSDKLEELRTGEERPKDAYAPYVELLGKYMEHYDKLTREGERNGTARKE